MDQSVEESPSLFSILFSKKVNGTEYQSIVAVFADVLET